MNAEGEYLLAMKRLLFAATFLILLSSSCSFTKDLEAHQAALLAAIGPEVSLSQKRDALGQSTVGMMHQAVDKLNPKRGAQFVKAYAKTNGPLIDTLAAQLMRGQRDMSRPERVAFMLGGASEPYVRDAVDLIPRFVRKYKQIQAVSRITGSLKDAVLGKAADRILGSFGQVDFDGPNPVVFLPADDWQREVETRALVVTR